MNLAWRFRRAAVPESSISYEQFSLREDFFSKVLDVQYFSFAGTRGVCLRESVELVA